MSEKAVQPNTQPLVAGDKRLSVIIPTYNEQLHITECLDSLLNQTLPPEDYELIVVDDGSKDKTPHILQEYANRLPERVKFLKQKHGGPALARNWGSTHARGKMLSFLDADMKFASDFLEKLITPIEKGEAVGTFTLDEFVANSDNLWSRSWSVCYYLPVNCRVPSDLKEEESTVFRAISRKDFWSVGGFDSTGYHDDHTVAKKLGKTASRVAGALCYHYNPGSAEEVFASAQWIGKSDKQPNSTKEWLRRSPPGALKRGIARAIEEKEPFYIIFEQVYSLGILTGMFWRNILHRDHSR
ncbi:glycosyltransferase family A protein [Candidatus Chlorohelix sp.]|uniref:glycosyltransferase family 2 protein n=1 Tax=Candidatus Chlorohelix sp. TaxID=3139201 RepID=UPI00304A973E